MKKIQLLVVVLFCLTTVAQSIKPNPKNALESTVQLPKVNNRAFKKGEYLEYRIHYGLIDAGTASLQVMNENKKISNRDVYHVIGTGKTNRFFDFFFKVRDTYETYIDTEGLFPWLFVRRVNEGGHKINQDYTFQQDRKMVNNGKGENFDVPIGIQDMVSAFYHARSTDCSKLKRGEIISLQTFIDDAIWPAGMKYLGTDTLKVETGTYSCLKFAPVVQKGRIFKNEEDLVVWITNDENKIPVQASAKIMVGAIKMDLVNYSGLANPIAKFD